MRHSFDWKVFLSIVTVIGAALVSATASASMEALPTSDNPTTKAVTIGVMVTAWARTGYPPLGDVTFTEGNSTLGVAGLACIPPYAQPVDCEVRLSVPGLALGAHTITASYSGEEYWGIPPESLTFTIYVSELAWLPAVLELLSD
jgi:hypothetical protein